MFNQHGKSYFQIFHKIISKTKKKATKKDFPSKENTKKPKEETDLEEKGTDGSVFKRVEKSRVQEMLMLGLVRNFIL